MGGLFGDASTPKVTPPPPLPERNDPAVAESKRRERNAAALRRGRRSTVLTGNNETLGSPNVNRPQATTSVL